MCKLELRWKYECLREGSLSPLETHKDISHWSVAFNFNDDLLQQQEKQQLNKKKGK